MLATIGEKAAALGASECCLVTNLADGADSIFADEALSLGWPLDAVLPFPRDDYAADYAEGALANAFARQLGKARAVFELPGVHDGAAAWVAGRSPAGCGSTSDPQQQDRNWRGKETSRAFSLKYGLKVRPHLRSVPQVTDPYSGKLASSRLIAPVAPIEHRAIPAQCFELGEIDFAEQPLRAIHFA